MCEEKWKVSSINYEIFLLYDDFVVGNIDLQVRRMVHVIAMGNELNNECAAYSQSLEM